MPEDANSHNSNDPMELWRDWNEATARMWSSTLDVAKDAYGDPHGLSHLWVKSFGTFQEQLKTNPTGMVDPVEVWKQWADATTDAWRRAAEAGKDSVKLSDQWLKILEETRAKIQSGEINSQDPVTFFKQWYDATNEMWAQLVGDMMNSERFLEANRQFIEAYTSAVKTSHRINQEIYQHLQLPSRSDITRVAVLVVSLEEKVDKIEDAFENFEESYAQVAKNEAVEGLAERLERVESQLNRLLTFEESHTQAAKSTEVEGLAKRLEQVEGQLNRLLASMEKLEVRGSEEPTGSNGGTQRKTPRRTSRTRQPKAAEEETKPEQ
jgi:polyhydroxyalkanoic acid synthase PhaR subunit